MSKKMPEGYVPCIGVRSVGSAAIETLSASLPPTEKALREVLKISAETPLRALSHDDWVVIGVAANDPPITLHWCETHPVTMRGPSALFLLDCNRVNRAGAVEDFTGGRPPNADSLAQFETLLEPGDYEGQAVELRKWKWGEPFPSLNSANRREREERVAEILEPILQALGIGGAVIGARASDTFSIENMKWSDCPRDYNHILEVPAYAASTSDNFPALHTILLSCISFYLAQVQDLYRKGKITPEIAAERFQEITDTAKLLRTYGETAKKVPDWPLTADLWKPKPKQEKA